VLSAPWEARQLPKARATEPSGVHMSKTEFEQQVEAAKREFEMEVAAIRHEFSNKLETVNRERNKKSETAFTRKAKALLRELENDLLKQNL
jgi:hypothetical protein